MSDPSHEQQAPQAPVQGQPEEAPEEWREERDMDDRPADDLIKHADDEEDAESYTGEELPDDAQEG